MSTVCVFSVNVDQRTLVLENMPHVQIAVLTNMPQLVVHKGIAVLRFSALQDSAFVIMLHHYFMNLKLSRKMNVSDFFHQKLKSRRFNQPIGGTWLVWRMY